MIIRLNYIDGNNPYELFGTPDNSAINAGDAATIWTITNQQAEL
jgi:hypothetical protein